MMNWFSMVLKISSMKKDITINIICGLFIFLFVYASIAKLLEFHSFKAVLSQSPLIAGYAMIIALLLPFAEIGIAVLLLFPSMRRIGLYASFALLLLFTGYIAYMIVFTPHLPCSCGGVIKQMSWLQHLVFNIAWILLALIGIWLTECDHANTLGVQKGVDYIGIK